MSSTTATLTLPPLVMVQALPMLMSPPTGLAPSWPSKDCRQSRCHRQPDKLSDSQARYWAQSASVLNTGSCTTTDGDGDSGTIPIAVSPGVSPATSTASTAPPTRAAKLATTATSRHDGSFERVARSRRDVDEVSLVTTRLSNSGLLWQGCSRQKTAAHCPTAAPDAQCFASPSFPAAPKPSPEPHGRPCSAWRYFCDTPLAWRNRDRRR